MNFIYSKQEIIEIIHNNWPESITMNKVEGIIEMTNYYTNDEKKNLRNAHINTIVKVKDGTHYFPIGGGISSSGTSLDVVYHHDFYKSILDNIEKDIKKNISFYKNEIEQVKKKVTDDLSFKLIEYQRKNVFVLEENNNVEFKFEI